MNQSIDPVVQKARDFAVRAHGNQLYGDQPYVVHLDEVAALLDGLDGVYRVKVLAYLHDVLEDTSVGYEQIRDAFGEYTADCVIFLTDPDGGSRVERKIRLHRILKSLDTRWTPVLVVKAADRLANLRRSIQSPEKRFIEMYRREHAEFRDAVWRNGICNWIWHKIDQIMAET